MVNLVLQIKNLPKYHYQKHYNPNYTDLQEIFIMNLAQNPFVFVMQYD